MGGAAAPGFGNAPPHRGQTHTGNSSRIVVKPRLRAPLGLILDLDAAVLSCNLVALGHHHVCGAIERQLDFPRGRKQAGNRLTRIRRIADECRPEFGLEVLGCDISESLFHLGVGRIAEIFRCGRKQVDVVFDLEGGLTDPVLLRMMKVAHRDAKRVVGFEPGPGIGRRAHMAELARGSAAAGHDARQAAHPLFMQRPDALGRAGDPGALMLVRRLCRAGHRCHCDKTVSPLGTIARDCWRQSGPG